MSNLFWLTEAQMVRLRPFFPKSHGRPRVDDLRVLSGIIFINRNGLRWCDAPREYGPAKALYNRWKRWSDNGVFARIMVGLAAEGTDPKLARLFLPGGPPFAAHVSYYGCSIPRLDDPTTSGAPVTILLGEKDRNVSIPRVQDIADDLRWGGSDTDAITYDGIYH